MPSLRHCSGGPPPSAIHGRGRLPRHPCRGAPYATPAFGLWERGGSSRSKAEATARQRQDQQLREQARSHSWTGYIPTEQDRSEGMPSLGEAPNDGGRSALVTFALFESDSL
ncbi:hypothetical protein F6R97_24820 [Pseudomonas sp. JV414]|nr:hypothetical protein [Pseudomonas sp. JV414]